MADDEGTAAEAVADLLEEMDARLDALEKSFGVVMLTLSRYQPEAMDMLIEGFDKFVALSRRDNEHAAQTETYDRLGTSLRDFRDNVLGEGKPPTPAQPNRTTRRAAERAARKPKKSS